MLAANEFNENKAIFDFPGIGIVKISDLNLSFDTIPPFADDERIVEYFPNDFTSSFVANTNPGYTSVSDTVATQPMVRATDGRVGGLGIYSVDITFQDAGDFTNPAFGWEALHVFEAFSDIYLVNSTNNDSSGYADRLVLFKLNQETNTFVHMPVDGYLDFVLSNLPNARNQFDSSVVTIDDEVVFAVNGTHNIFTLPFSTGDTAISFLRISRDGTITSDYLRESEILAQDSRVTAVNLQSSTSAALIAVDIGSQGIALSSASITAPTLDDGDFPLPFVTEQGHIHYIVNKTVTYGYPYDPFVTPRRIDRLEVENFPEGFYGRVDIISGLPYLALYTNTQLGADLQFNINGVPAANQIRVNRIVGSIIQPDLSYLTYVSGTVVSDQGNQVEINSYLHRAGLDSPMQVAFLQIMGEFGSNDASFKIFENNNLAVCNRAGDILRSNRTTGTQFLARGSKFAVDAGHQVRLLIGFSYEQTDRRTEYRHTSYGFVSLFSQNATVVNAAAAPKLVFIQAHPFFDD